jgi:hypothetical protein
MNKNVFISKTENRKVKRPCLWEGERKMKGCKGESGGNMMYENV